MKIHDVKISELVFADYNPRVLTKKQFKELKDSLSLFGFVDPVIVNENEKRKNVIVGGHQRVRAWEALKHSTVPVYYVNLPIEKEKELNIRLNKSGGDWDFDILSSEFDMGDLLEWGFDPFEFEGAADEIVDETEGDDDLPDEPIKAKTVMGDIYKLGEHILICGDNSNANIYSEIIDNNIIETIILDPPFEKPELLNEIDFNLLSKSNDIFVFGDCNRNTPLPYSEKLEHKWHFEFIWDCVQRWIIPGKPVLAHKKIDWYSVDPEYDHEIVKDPREKREKSLKGKNKRGSFEIEADPRGQSLQSVFVSSICQEGHGAEHSKPVLWLKMIIGNCSKGIVFDPFIGSGTTLIACEGINRKCVGIEINPIYCDVIVSRYISWCKKNDKKYSVELNGEKISWV